MRLPVVLLLLGLLAPVHAAEVTVNYLVDDSALKDAASGSLLQPTLFTDAGGGAFCGGCTTGKSCVSSGIQNSNCVSQACTVGGVCQ
jgi:hypothetical protein